MKIASFLEGRVNVLVGDITNQKADAIVNAANKTLYGGGGVDGTIHRVGGPKILAECRILRETKYPEGLPTGHVVVTTAGKLPASYVIHTVGPIYGRENGGEPRLLADCYSNCLKVADSMQIESILFPSISTGAFQYPKYLAAEIASRTISEMVSKLTYVTDIGLIFFSEGDARKFLKHCEFA